MNHPLNSHWSPRKPLSTNTPLRAGILAACLMTAVVPVRANWVQTTAGTYDYFGAANWSSGTPNGVFSGTLAGAVVITTGSDIATGTAGLQFLEGGNYLLTLRSTGANHTLTLNGDVTVDLSGVAGTVTIGNATSGQNLAVNLAGENRTLYVAGTSYSLDTLKLMNTVSNGGITKTGAGILQLSGSNSYTGDTYVKNGTLLLNSSGVLNSSKIYISTSGGYTGNDGESLTRVSLDNTSAGSNADRVVDTAGLYLNSGAIYLSNPSNTNLTENVGVLTLEGGSSLLETSRSTGGYVKLNISSLVRTNQSVLRVSGASLGTAGYSLITLTDATSVTNDMVGGSGAAGSHNISIIPWITGVTSGQRFDRGATSFVTYDATTGFRYLDTTTEYRQGLNTSGTSTDNVRVTSSEALTSSQTINSLLFDVGPTNTISGAYTLTISSGAVLARSAATSSGVNRITVSSLDFAGHEAVIGVSGTAGAASSLDVSSVIKNTGGNGLTKYGNGELRLSGANTYTGDTVVDEGQITSYGNAIPDASNLRVSSMGRFAVSGGASDQVKSLAGTGTIYLDSTTARLNVGTNLLTGAAGKITVGAGGIIAPGDPSGAQQAGLLTLGVASTKATSLQLLSGAEIDIDISSTSLFDSIAVVNGSASLAGKLDLSYLDGYMPTDGDMFKILTTTGGVTGDVDVITVDGVAASGYTTEVSGNDLYLIYTAVPEPSTYAMLIGGVGLLIGAQRMRRRS